MTQMGISEMAFNIENQIISQKVLIVSGVLHILNCILVNMCLFKRLNTKEVEDNEATPLTLTHYMGPFILLVCFLCTSMFIFTSELLLFKFKKY